MPRAACCWSPTKTASIGASPRGTGRAAPIPAASGSDRGARFWLAVGAEGRIIDFDAHARRLGEPARPRWHAPNGCSTRPAWTGVPLIHDDRLVGLVLLAAPDYRRPLDWEDFDLLRAAGRQAASSLAEAHGQQALIERPAVRGFQPPLRLHPPRHQESGQPALAAVPQRRAARRQSRVPRRHGRDAAKLGRQDERPARPARAAGPDAARKREPTPLRTILVASAIAAKRRDHEVKLLGDGSLWVVADPLLLEQAVGHLVQNAGRGQHAGGAGHRRDGRRERRRGRHRHRRPGTGMDADFVRTACSSRSPRPSRAASASARSKPSSLVAAMGGRLTVETARPARAPASPSPPRAPKPAAQPKRKIA